MDIHTVYIMIFVAGFSLGFAVGLGVGLYFLVIRPKRSMIVVSPEGQMLVDCQTECLKTHRFGSDEWYKCVEECYPKKNPTAHRS